MLWGCSGVTNDGMVPLTDPVNTAVGGMGGHLLRRSIHLGMCAIPWAVYVHGGRAADLLGLADVAQVVSAFVLLVVLAEALRLRFGITVFGQREYEATQVSALAWGAVAIGVVLLALPEAKFGAPLILSLAFGDPLLGELRRAGRSPKTVFVTGTVVLLMVWVGCVVWLGTPWLLAVVLPPLCVAAEWPRLRWIDDNATMLLLPLMAVMLLSPWL
jgi:hypothetical protein